MYNPSEVKAVSEILSLHWPRIKNVLEENSAEEPFLKYVETYRGLSETSRHTREQDFQGKRELFLNDFLISVDACLEKVAQAPQAISLRTFEQIFNVLLYYWCGRNDRNCYFRTFVHFFDLKGESVELEVDKMGSLYLTFMEDGLVIETQQSKDFRLPLVLPISALLVTFTQEDKKTKTEEQLVFARARTCQREVFLLVDEWEHRNAVLAVENTDLLERFERASEDQIEALLLESQEKLGGYRNHWAHWLTYSLVDLYKWTVGLLQEDRFSRDVLSELQALERLILSAIQKVFLPASVSRHKYSEETVAVILDWVEFREKEFPDDVSTQLLKASLKSYFKSVQLSDFNFTFMDAKPHEWSLHYDPSSALKSFCYRYGEKVHAYLCTAFLIVIARKKSPVPIDTFWLSTFLSMVQMPETFPGEPKPEDLFEPAFALPQFDALARKALAVLKDMPRKEDADLLEHSEKVIENWRKLYA